MKILGKTAYGYMVDMTENEIALAAGYYGSYDSLWVAARPTENFARGDWSLAIGAEIDVSAAYNFHSRITSHQEKAREAAGTLRALAGLLDGVMPDVVLPPPDTRSSGPATEGSN